MSSCSDIQYKDLYRAYLKKQNKKNTSLCLFLEVPLSFVNKWMENHLEISTIICVGELANFQSI